METLQYEQLIRTQFGNLICVNKIDGYEVTVIQNECSLVLVMHYDEFCRAIVLYNYVAGRYNYTTLFNAMTDEKLEELVEKFTKSWVVK